MRITIPSTQELNERAGIVAGSVNGGPFINGLLPALGDCELLDDHGNPITNASEVVIRMRPGQPIEAIVTRGDVHGTIEAVDVVASQHECLKQGRLEGLRAAQVAVAGCRARGFDIEAPCCSAEYDAIEKALVKLIEDQEP